MTKEEVESMTFEERTKLFRQLAETLEPSPIAEELRRAKLTREIKEIRDELVTF